MANKEELIKKIAETAIEQGVEIPETEGLKNKELEEILSGLNPDPTTSAKPKKATKKKLPPYSVKKGSSIACIKGVVGSECEMKVEYVAGGQKSFDALVEAGHIVKN